MTEILNPEVLTLKSKIDESAKDLHDLTAHIANKELMETVSDLRNRINEPFMFVIVGEVKAGKSSFINALLDASKEICKVGPQPVTDTIQQILYGDKEDEVVVNKYLKKVYQPVDILQDIAIVDTPGTNTIIEQHQEITERFIPASDLIVFVFEAKNPYRQSSWDFFDYIHQDWQKKTIFVLQQKDLMPEEDLKVNEKGLQDYAQKKGVFNPKVFSVSAKQEIDGQKEQSGFIGLRRFIQENITGGKAPVLKLENNIKICINIHQKIGQGLEIRQRQFESDIEFREDIALTIDKNEKKSQNQLKILLGNLLGSYDRVTSKAERELSSGLSFFSLLKRSFAAIFTSKSSAKKWLDDLTHQLEEDMNTELHLRLNEGIEDLAESIQQMAKIVELKIQNSKTILKPHNEIFSDIAQRRNNAISELKTSFAHFLNNSEDFSGKELFTDSGSISPSIATGSGIAVIGVILAAVTNGMVFDITGGVLTTIGLLFAGITSGTKRRKILNSYRKEIEKGRDRLELEVREKLQAYIQHVKKNIQSNFLEFDQMLETEEKQLNELHKRQAHIDTQLNEIKEQVDKLLA